MKYKIKIITCLLSLFVAISVKSQPGCPSVSAGGDQTISCSGACANLSATVLATGSTTSYAVTSIPFSPPYPFSVGTPILINLDDVWGDVINLPFNFCFFGTLYNQIVVGANGCITFDITNADQYNAWKYTCSCPNPDIINGSTGPYILGPYHDIDPALGGNIYEAVIGAYPCRTFVVNYFEVPMYNFSFCPGLTSTHQIVLYESTNVIEVYMQLIPLCTAWNDGNSTVGIQNADGTVGFSPPGRNTGPWSTSVEAWRFTPNGATNCVVSWWQSGQQIAAGPTTTVCPTATTTYTAQAIYTNCDGSQITVTDDMVVNVSGGDMGLTINPANPVVCGGSSDTLTATCNDSNAIYNWSTNDTIASIIINPSSTTTYTVTVSNGSGCIQSDSVIVTVNPVLPPAPTVSSPVTLCQNKNSTTLTATGSNLLWYTSATGGTGSTIAPTPSTAIAGTTNYYVSQAPSGCESSRAMIKVIVKPAPNPVISGNTVSCVGAQRIMYSTDDGMSNYIWDVTGGHTTTNNGSSVLVFWTTEGHDTIKVTYTGADGCTGTTSYPVTVNPTPATPTITKKGNELISSSATGNQWYDANGPITGDTSSTFTPPGNGTYYDVVTKDSCASLPSNDITLGINTLTENSAFNLYPNPNDGNFTIEILGVVGKVYMLEIRNVLGMKVFEQNITTSNTKYIQNLNVSDLNDGIYILKIQIKDQTSVLKLVVRH